MSDAQVPSEQQLPLLCHLGIWHRWSKWSDGDFMEKTHYGIAYERRLVQKRKCKGCDAVEFRNLPVVSVRD